LLAAMAFFQRMGLLFNSFESFGQTVLMHMNDVVNLPIAQIIDGLID
jgi:hypothetical protein